MDGGQEEEGGWAERGSVKGYIPGISYNGGRFNVLRPVQRDRIYN